MAIKMIVTDLDGTLLTSNHTVSLQTAAALKQANDQGILVMPASGRPLSGVVSYFKEIGISPDNYAVVFNGGMVQKLTGEVVVSHLLSYEDLTDLIKLSEGSQCTLQFMQKDCYLTLESQLSDLMKLTTKLTKMPFKFIKKEELSSDFTFIKAEFLGSASEIAKLKAKIPKDWYQRWEISGSGDQIIEINAPGATKGNAVHELAEKLKIKDSEVVVFGDQANDLSMFKNDSFCKVAMGNAIDDLKKRATFVTASHDDDGIAKALKQIL